MKIQTSVLLIAVFAALLFFPFLGQVHLFDWDEANFAEAAREMVITGEYFKVQINYAPFWEKPPLFIWFQAASMNIFGINEFGARFPNAICGILTLIVLFLIGRKLYDDTFGWIWVLAYAGSILPHFYFKSGIIDPWFNFFIFLGIYFIAEAIYADSKKWRFYLIAGVFTGLGVMTKGPVALLLFGLVYFVFLVIKKFRYFPKPTNLLTLLLSIIFAGSIWFIIEIINGRFYIVSEFIVYQIRLLSTQDAGHGGPFYYHFVVILIGCFPASFFCLGGLLKRGQTTDKQSDLRLLMIILLLTVLIVFSIVKTKILHYSSLSYFPVTFLATFYIWRWIKGQIKLPGWLKTSVIFSGILLSSAFIMFPILMINKYNWVNSDILKDPFAKAQLGALVNWSGFEFAGGLFLMAGIIMFFVFSNRNILLSILSLFIGAMITINLALVLITPKMEHYVQGAAIEFYKDHSDGNSYVYPLGFKSYAYIFYSEKTPDIPENHADEDWLCSGDIDKPVYFIVRNYQADFYKNKYPQLSKLYEKNGFVFYVREVGY